MTDLAMGLPASLEVRFYTIAAVGIGFAVADRWIRYRNRSLLPPSQLGSAEDRGSLAVLGVCAVAYIVVAIGAAIDGLLILPWYAYYAGILVMVVGVAVRLWAIATLGRFFSPVVRTTADQRIIRSGPYRVVRHPVYTGLLLMLLGITIAMLSGVGLFVGAVLLAIGLGYRIRVEETALIQRFGPEYNAYRRSTWRLFPYLF
jgi:protein-S-isoprenylcysteine O-methyltransferase Ste14